MTAFEIGRLCEKKTGRETGKQCIVVDVIDKNFVLVTGPLDVTGVRRRRANVDHLVPSDVVIDIRKGAGDDAVKKVLDKLSSPAKAVAKPKKRRTPKKENDEEPRKRAEKKEKEAEETVEEEGEESGDAD